MTRRGRPVIHTEPWSKVTLVLLEQHVAYLDALAAEIYAKHGVRMTRGAIIRALVEAAAASRMDLDADTGEVLSRLLNMKKNR